jgi:hypothetical protein
VAASAINQLQFTAVIENPFAVSSGVFLHDFFIEYSPIDFSGQLQITAIRAGLGVVPTASTAGDIDYGLGIATATNLSPTSAQTILNERDKLITARDIAALGNVTFGGILNVSYSVVVKNNDAAAAHSYSAFIKLVYTRLDGLLE